MAKGEKFRLHAVVHGRVQGVSFRYFVSENAWKLGVKGWVRNLMNGSVELVVEGQREDLENLLTKLDQGPRSARVNNVQCEWEEATGEFNRFQIRMTV